MWDEASINTAIARIKDCSIEQENYIFNKYIGMIVSLAAKKIDGRFRARIDPESIAMSVMESFFDGVRHEKFDFDNWEMVYGLLVKITLRKSHNRNVLLGARRFRISVSRNGRRGTRGPARRRRSSPRTCWMPSGRA